MHKTLKLKRFDFFNLCSIFSNFFQLQIGIVDQITSNLHNRSITFGNGRYSSIFIGENIPLTVIYIYTSNTLHFSWHHFHLEITIGNPLGKKCQVRMGNPNRALRGSPFFEKKKLTL